MYACVRQNRGLNVCVCLAEGWSDSLCLYLVKARTNCECDLAKARTDYFVFGRI